MDPSVTIDIVVKETQRVLCVLEMRESDTVMDLKGEVARRNSGVIQRNLFISEA